MGMEAHHHPVRLSAGLADPAQMILDGFVVALARLVEAIAAHEMLPENTHFRGLVGRRLLV